jgi:hypothetical protein
MHRRCTASLKLRLPRQTLPTLSPRRISSSSSSAWPCAACPLLLLLLAPARPNTCLPARCLPANPSHHHHHHHHHPSSSSTSHAAVATPPLPHCHTATPRRRRRPALGPTGSTRPRRPTQPVPASPSQSHPPCHACPAAPAVLLLRAKRAPAARLQPHSSSPTTLHFPPAQLQTASAAASLQPPTHAHVQSRKSPAPSPSPKSHPGSVPICLHLGAALPRCRCPCFASPCLALPCPALSCPVLSCLCHARPTTTLVPSPLAVRAPVHDQQSFATAPSQYQSLPTKGSSAAPLRTSPHLSRSAQHRTAPHHSFACDGASSMATSLPSLLTRSTDTQLTPPNPPNSWRPQRERSLRRSLVPLLVPSGPLRLPLPRTIPMAQPLAHTSQSRRAASLLDSRPSL